MVYVTRRELCATWLGAFQGLVPPCLPGVPGNNVVSSDPSMYTCQVGAECNFEADDIRVTTVSHCA